MADASMTPTVDKMVEGEWVAVQPRVGCWRLIRLDERATLTFTRSGIEYATERDALDAVAAMAQRDVDGGRQAG